MEKAFNCPPSKASIKVNGNSKRKIGDKLFLLKKAGQYFFCVTGSKAKRKLIRSNNWVTSRIVKYLQSLERNKVNKDRENKATEYTAVLTLNNLLAK